MAFGVGYLRQHPDATLAQTFEASMAERQEVYKWLFKTRHKNAQDKRIKQLLEVDGEMRAGTALDSKVLNSRIPDSTRKGDANLLVMPNIDAANIAYSWLKTTSGSGIAIGPILLGCATPVHILTPSATVRRIVNTTALCVVNATSPRQRTCAR